MNKNKQPEFSAKSIVTEIRNNIREKSEVFQIFLEENTTAEIDPGRDSEYLGAGWLKNTVYHDVVVKPVKERFEFKINAHGAKEIRINLATEGRNSFIAGPFLSLQQGKKKLGKVKIGYPFFTNARFKLSSAPEKNLQKFTGYLEFKKERCPVYIRMITAVKRELMGNEKELVLLELDNVKKTTEQLIEILDLHKNPEWLLPADTNRSNFGKKLKRLFKKAILAFLKPVEDSIYLKKFVLHSIRPFTTPQVAFNKYLLDVLKLQSKKIDLIGSLVINQGKNSDKSQDEENTPNS